MFVEPCVAVGGRDALGLPPSKERLDERMDIAKLSQSLSPRVRQIDPHALEERPHLPGAAEIDAPTHRRMHEDSRVALVTQRCLICLTVGACTDGRGDDLFGHRATHGEPVGGQLRAEVLGVRCSRGRPVRLVTVTLSKGKVAG